MTKTIAQKMGVKPGMTWIVHDMPDNVGSLFGPLDMAAGEVPDIILSFVTDVAGVESALQKVLPLYKAGNRLWFAYPKKSGKIKTDISRDNGWAALVAQDLLPVTQVAIDDTWSALRFRHRHEIAKLTRKGDLPGAGEKH